MDNMRKDESEMEELSRKAYTSVKCVLNQQVVNMLNDLPGDVKVQLESSTGVKFEGDSIIGKWREVHEARMSLLRLMNSRPRAKEQSTDQPNRENILVGEDRAGMHEGQPSGSPGEITKDPSLSSTSNELVLSDESESCNKDDSRSAEDSSNQPTTTIAVDIVEDADTNKKEGNGNEAEELASETYISLKCVLDPQLVNMLNDSTEDVKVQLETSTGIKFDGTDSIIGKWQEIHEANASLLRLISSRANDKDQHTDRQSLENGSDDQHVARTHEKQLSYTPPTDGKTTETQSKSNKDSSDSKRNDRNTAATKTIGRCWHSPCYLRSEPLSYPKSTVQYMVEYLQKEVEEEMKYHTVYITFVENKDFALITCCGEDEEDASQQIWNFDFYCDEVHRNLWYLNFPLCPISEDHDTRFLFSGIQCIAYEQIVAAYEKKSKNEVEKRLHSFFETRRAAAESQCLTDKAGVKGRSANVQKTSRDEATSHASEHNDKYTGATETIGKCRHNPCDVRSKPLTFPKPIIQYIIRYLQKEVEDLMENQAVFVTFLENEDSALVKCCGKNAAEARRGIRKLDIYSKNVSEKLRTEKFPLRPTTDDDTTEFIFSGVKYIINKRIVVVYEIKHRNEIARRLLSLYETRSATADSQSLLDEMATERDRVKKELEAPKFCAGQPRHSLVIESLNPYYWNHLSSHSEPFIKEIDVLLKENGLTLREEGGKLVVEGQCLQYLKKFQTFLINKYIMLSADLKTLSVKPNEMDLAKLTRQHPQTTVALDDTGEIVLVSESRIIDDLLNELGTIKVTASTDREQMARNVKMDKVKPMGKVPCGFLFNNKTKVFIYEADITQLYVDAIVNAANGQLMHGAGVSKAISDAAGPDLEKESNRIRITKGIIPVSQTEVTSAGYLICKHVIHAVGPCWPRTDNENEKRKCLRLLYNTFTNVLSTADRFQFESIGMPPISSGIFEVPIQEVASAMFEALIDTPTRNLKEVHIVDIKGPILSVIVGTFLTKRRHKIKHVSDLDQEAVLRTINLCLKKDVATGRLHQRIQIFVYQGDVTDTISDAIVCANDHDLSCSAGVAKRIADKEGRQYREACRRAVAVRDLQLQATDVITVKSRNHGLIIHAITPELYSSSGKKLSSDAEFGQLLYTTFYNAITEARRHNIRTLAISALCEDNIFVPNVWISLALASALHSGFMGDTRTETIYIVSKNRDTLQMLEKRLCNTPMPITTGIIPKEELPQRRQRDQPIGGSMHVIKIANQHLPGYDTVGTIVILYNIPDGIQEEEHPRPGKMYLGTIKTAFLPDNTEGNKVLTLLRKAFEARLIFTIDKLATTGHDEMVVWSDITHKTSVHGGPRRFGYPDSTYLMRVQEELAVNGIW